jgi:hypothetical protein
MDGWVLVACGSGQPGNCRVTAWQSLRCVSVNMPSFGVCLGGDDGRVGPPGVRRLAVGHPICECVNNLVYFSRLF